MTVFSTPLDAPADVQVARARAAGVRLAADFYRLAPEARAAAFTVSGLARLDQVQAIADSLTAAQANGTSFANWQKWALAQDWTLPPGRIETIYRNAVQTNYNAGQWRHFLANRTARPFLLYDAINDSRVRPSHLAMDGVIRPVDDPIWDTHAAPRDHNCRCALRAITAAKAERLGGVTETIPMEAADPRAWKSNPRQWSDTLADIARTRADAQTSPASAPAVHRATTDAAAQLAALIAATRAADLTAEVMQAAIGTSAWRAATLALAGRQMPPQVAAAGLTVPERVALHLWAQPAGPEEYPAKINEAIRAAVIDAAAMAAHWPVVTAIRSAIAKLPPKPGIAYRAIDPADLADPAAFIAAHEPGALVMLTGFTSASSLPPRFAAGRIVLIIDSRDARAIDFAATEANQMELIFDHGTVLRVLMRETLADGGIRIWLASV